jgi:hypothetical protein
VITDFLLGGFLAIVRAIVNLVPEWGPDVSGVTGSAESIGNVAASANGWFPVGALVGVLVVVFAYRLVLMVWRGITRLYELLPFKFS